MDAAAGTTVGGDAVRLDQAIELPSPYVAGSGGTGPAGGEMDEPASSYAGSVGSGADASIDLLACEKIKEALRQHGALDFGMHEPLEGDGYWADADVEQGIWKHHWFYDADTADYAVNHSLSLVGWDDAYPKENFTIVVDGIAHTPDNDGAWILRNNRGEGFGDGGYLYVPYEERAVRAPVALAAESGRDGAFDYAKNYQYDSLHAVGLQASWGDAAKAANVFIASDDERLEGVGVWVTSPAVRVTIDVYTGLADPANPESGTRAGRSRPHGVRRAERRLSHTRAGKRGRPREGADVRRRRDRDAALRPAGVGPHVVHRAARRRATGGREPRRHAPLRQRPAR